MTDIRKSTYQLCKSVWATKDRDRLRELIWGLNRRPDDLSSGVDRSHLGYAARQVGGQFIGYLIVNRDKTEIEKSFPPLAWSPSLDQDERSLFIGAHKQILNLNMSCIQPLTERLPQYTNVVNPYNIFNYQIPEEFAEVNIFTDTTATKVVEAFHKHPAFDIALHNAALLTEAIPEHQIGQYVIDLEKTILSTGPMSSPRKLADASLTHPEDSQARILLRLTAAFICLRASLTVLNELIFRALLTEKLPVISDENIIQFGSLTSHFCSQGLSCTCQPDENIDPFTLGLVLVKCSFLEFPVDLCRTESIHFQMSDDIGDVAELKLRLIDDNLNPFDGLLRNM